MGTEYATHDLPLCAFLLESGARIIGTRPAPRGRTAYVFDLTNVDLDNLAKKFEEAAANLRGIRADVAKDGMTLKMIFKSLVVYTIFLKYIDLKDAVLDEKR